MNIFEGKQSLGSKEVSLRGHLAFFVSLPIYET